MALENATLSPATVRVAPSSLLDPAALGRISRLELVARQFMDGYVQGLHRSNHLGFAIDFAQHRQYVPGDDIKRIDWRVFAKADRYYIKQYEVNTNLQAHIVLDVSGSMKYRGVNEPLSKMRYGQFLVTCLAYLALRQQDSVGLITLDNQIRKFIPPRSAPSHLMNIIEALEESESGGESSLAQRLHEVAERIGHRGLVILISDCFEKTDAFIQALHHFRHRRHELLLLHVMADDEINFPFRKWTLFENLERSGHQLRLDPSLVRARYMTRLREHMAAIHEATNSLRISRAVLNTREPFDQALTAYLAQRMYERRS
jgi:uncharacterized protein (DUF58 family)